MTSGRIVQDGGQGLGAISRRRHRVALEGEGTLSTAFTHRAVVFDDEHACKCPCSTISHPALSRQLLPESMKALWEWYGALKSPKLRARYPDVKI